MNWTLEQVAVPVTDVDRAMAFYADQLGFNVDFEVDVQGTRMVQLTPPGSGCSIVIRVDNEMAPGSIRGLLLVVPDLPAAHAQLAERGVEVSEIEVFAEHGPRPRQERDNLDNVGFAYFADPDGNGWAVQQISSRE